MHFLDQYHEEAHFQQGESHPNADRLLSMEDVFDTILEKEVSRSTPLLQLLLIRSVTRKIKDDWCIPNVYTTEERLASRQERCISKYIDELTLG